MAVYLPTTPTTPTIIYSVHLCFLIVENARVGVLLKFVTTDIIYTEAFCNFVIHFDTGTELLNYLIILIKLHICISRKHGVTPNFNVFKEIVKVKFRTEKYLALKNNTECKFRARWQPYLNSTLVT